MDVETLRALRSPEGSALLAEACRAYGDEDGFALGTRLRRSHPAELVAAALTQARLRARAVEKFGADAARMYFTVDGYEQATRVSVAEHRAARLAGVLGPGAAVVDLCCGIGGDLVALARAGLAVTGIELDPVTAEVARANIAALAPTASDPTASGLPATVVEADATTVDRARFAAPICDPSRRSPRGRVFDPDGYRPPWSFVLDLLAGTACVKVAPGIPHARLPDGVEAEWVSERGEVKEAALWSGAFAADGVRRRATLLTPAAASPQTRATRAPSGPMTPPTAATLTDADDPGGAGVREPGAYLYEPDGAVIRAGLVTAVAALVEGWLHDPSIAYVGSDQLVETPFARGYQVTDVLPYDVKALRRYVREHRIGILTVKKRGVGVEPTRLRAELRPKGDAEATLVVTRVSGRATVLVVQPLLAPG